MNENKIYECFLVYESKKVPYYIKVNYEQENYYVMGRKKNNMCFEYIFGDFANKKIDNKKCYIEYDGKKYFAHDDNNFSKLRCLNLINIDLNLIKFPLDHKNEVIPFKNFNETSFFVFISVAEKTPKIFGVFSNKQFIEKSFRYSANEIVEVLQTSLKKVQSILNYDEKKSYKEYIEGIKMNELPTTYVEEIKNSLKLEIEIMPFFSFYRPTLTENDILAFNVYCEFMLAFSSFHSMKRTNKEIIPYKFYKQHYYSHKVIEKFMKTIPSYVNKTEGIYLKYAACRCLRSLIFEGFSFDYDDLFYFCDLNIPRNYL